MNIQLYHRVFDPLVLFSTEADEGHSNSYFLFLPCTFMYFKIQINDPVDEFQFFIPNSIFGTCAISRLFLLLNKKWSASTMNCLLELSVSEMFPVKLGS